ncbi:alcohol dehydrogenase [Alkanindiges hydrocarboniclasticus]|uniref:Alcohol dehydrogenase n=1 Tax=Alkanindiges hydrocarboniclasticus TaxID=1907941 RepID=A0A1S8D089_9GAMM|nr:iron-containing alcohol dehydrogenase [Alkanindiges hydrocarboniclasticus]ONG42321.1 alcohol dehydrogenase [Alkanindiges hydrocarboniclasticus]
MNCFSFDTVKQIICAAGSRHQLGEHCKRLGLSHVMFVTDSGIVQYQLHHDALTSLNNVGIEYTIYDQVLADPPDHVILAAVEQATSKHIDGVIGYGGGSSMDVAKLIAILANPQQTQALSDMYGVGNIQGQRLPLIQVPTTAGTGSEVTSVAIVTTGETTKMGVVSPVLYADIALLDAELTTGLPPAVTAATGIDAMVHAIEAYTSVHKKNLYSDMLAKQALVLLDQNLQTAVHEGHNLEARQNMLFGAMLAGQAFANSPVAAVHALAYPLGGHYHISHGLSNALVLCEVIRFNLSHAARHYAELMLILNPAAQGSDMELANQLIDRLEQHILDSGLPCRLNQLNIPEQDLEMLARDAMLQTRLLVNNPRELNHADALAIYQAVYA